MATTEMNCLAGGGGLGTPVKLWENSSPTTAYAGSTTAVSLITGMKFSDYKYIRFDYKHSKDTSADDYRSILIPTDMWEQMAQADTIFFAFANIVGSAGYVRMLQYYSDTQVVIRECYRMATSGSDSNYLIPTYIWGIN